MTYTAHDPRLLTNAVIARLDSETTRPVGDAVAPDDDTRPYTVTDPLEDNPGEGSLNDPHQIANLVFRVVSVGDNREQAQWMQKQNRDALLGWSPVIAGHSCGPVHLESGGSVLREPDVQPPLFSAVDRYWVRVQQTS